MEGSMGEARHVADEGLIARARSGDDAAFKALCDRHAPQLAAYVWQRLAPALLRKISVADLLQETFLAAFQQLDRFEEVHAGSFGSWLTKLAQHRVLHAVRRYTGTAKRCTAREVSRDGRCTTGNFPGRAPSPSQAAIAEELRERARRVMEALPEDYRQVLSLRQQDHLTLDETAQRMGRSKDAVNKLYARALARLAEDLGLSDRRRP